MSVAVRAQVNLATPRRRLASGPEVCRLRRASLAALMWNLRDKFASFGNARMRRLVLVFSVAAVFCACRPGTPPATGHHYVTREQLEVDKLASIWLLQRFVDKDATFEFVKGDQPLTNGMPLDAPEAELRRYANNSCFETIAARFKVQDQRVQRLGRIVRELELNAWGEKKFAESVQLDAQIKRILDAHPHEPYICLQESLAVFDRLARDFAAADRPSAN